MNSDSDFDKIFNTLPGERAAEGALRPREQTRPRRETSRPSWGKRIFAGVALAVLVLSSTGIWLMWNEYGTRIIEYFAQEEVANFEGGGAEPAVEIVVNPGDIGETVARNLAESGVTASFESVYEILLQDATITFQPGTYRLLTGMSADSAIAALRDPNNRIQIEILITEGIIMERALEIIAEKASLSLDSLTEAVSEPTLYGVNPPSGSLEGYLFPATYQFEPGTSAGDIIARMVDEMKSRLTAMGVPEDQWHEVLTLASIVQREARFEEDFYKASRVFTNRLDIDMPLQSDATVAYWTGDYTGVSTSDADRADTDNPYNTYVRTGLPVGPISLPGEQAIDAAMNPADGDWLYFVSVDLRTGETIFSETYAEHLRAVDQWLSWCRESEENGAYC
ncbi:MAG: endolytic transglycosylase MltG [Pontimonas sp.]|nr:endolytic transglycosylase MltG [Pontimonas sp.]